MTEIIKRNKLQRKRKNCPNLNKFFYKRRQTKIFLQKYPIEIVILPFTVTLISTNGTLQHLSEKPLKENNFCNVSVYSIVSDYTKAAASLGT